MAGGFGIQTTGIQEIRHWMKWFIILLIFPLAAVACSSANTTEVWTPTTTDTISLLPTESPVPTTQIPLSPTITVSPVPPSPTPSHTPSPTTPPWPQNSWLFPDSEVVYSPSAAGFNVVQYLDHLGGFLSTYRQYLMITDWTTGPDIVTRVALENSINPRLLLALLEYQSGCVFGVIDQPEIFDTAMGAVQANRLDLYGQLVWAVHEISEGYYGWLNGTLSEIELTDGTIVVPHEISNPGTVAVQYFFGKLYDKAGYNRTQDPKTGFYALYEEMFDGSWDRAAKVEPLIPLDISQPALTLPFGPGKSWAYTGGPHYAFESSGPMAALDFAPPSDESGCYQSDDWVIAMADGIIVRSELGVVIQDLDGDGLEQTGWVLMYLHIEDRHRVPVGSVLSIGDHIGHPSCEGGRATGTHVHIARKYNGVWIPADGEVPFDLDGWIAHNGNAPYLGTLKRGDDVVTAHQYGSYISRISRDE